MKDTKGRNLQVGDAVAYVHGKNSDARLRTGHVTNIYQGRFKNEECSVDGNAHVLSKRIIKIPESEV